MCPAAQVSVSVAELEAIHKRDSAAHAQVFTCLGTSEMLRQHRLSLWPCALSPVLCCHCHSVESCLRRLPALRRDGVDALHRVATLRTWDDDR